MGILAEITGGYEDSSAEWDFMREGSGNFDLERDFGFCTASCDCGSRELGEVWESVFNERAVICRRQGKALRVENWIA